MTAKRFTIIYGVDENPFEWDIMDNEKDALICQYNGKPICDLLNELHEENEQLKGKASSWKITASEQIMEQSELVRENVKLKSELLDIEEDRDCYKSKASSLEEGYLQLQDREIRLKKENEQLKKQIEELKVDLKMAKIDGAINRMAQRPIRW